MLHDLKILPEWFNAVISGVKTFEIRKDEIGIRTVAILIALQEHCAMKRTFQQSKQNPLFTARTVHSGKARAYRARGSQDAERARADIGAGSDTTSAPAPKDGRR